MYTLDPEYSNCIELAGGVPVILTQNRANVATYVNMLDGLVMSGGGDVDPGSYGEENGGLSYDVNERSDAFEIALLKEAAARGIPTLGICRGFQLMQVAFDGTMYQDLHSEYPRHPKNQGGAEAILAQRHPVKLAENSWLAKAYGTTDHIVNTIHHQCVRTLGAGFRAVGWSEDGIVEAVESDTAWQAIGVQWHPEKLKTEAELGLFRSFITAVVESKQKERAR